MPTPQEWGRNLILLGLLGLKFAMFTIFVLRVGMLATFLQVACLVINQNSGQIKIFYMKI